MFLVLRGKPTGGPNGVPQSYVTTASNIFSSLFALILNTAITVAFTQHLWLIFRKNALKVSTIEALYKIRSDLLSLTALDSYRQAPLLILIAAFGWTISIAASFPPGAFTVQNALWDSVENVTVPTFDPYYVGNGEYLQLPALMSDLYITRWAPDSHPSPNEFYGTIALTEYALYFRFEGLILR